MINLIRNYFRTIINEVIPAEVDRSWLQLIEKDYNKGVEDNAKHKSIIQEHNDVDGLIELWKHCFDLIPLMGGLTYEDYLFTLVDELLQDLGIDPDEDERLKTYGYPE